MAGPQPTTRRHTMPFGAAFDRDRTVFSLHAPLVDRVRLEIDGRGDGVAMERGEDGWHRAIVEGVEAGARYRYRLPSGQAVPDPASRFQPESVHGWSEVIDPDAFVWSDDDWRGRAWRETVLYELHVGTFTPAGTFLAASEKLDHLAALGVTAVELMPIAAFPGGRNWGYDGVLPYAPDAAYGRPEDLKLFVEAAHQRGIQVLLDVVYNHFGPRGIISRCSAPSSRSGTSRPGVRVSTTTAGMPRSCAPSPSTTHSTGWRNTISTGCASTRSTPSWTTAPST